MAQADIIIIIKDEREDRKVRAGRGVMPGYDITGVVLSVAFQWRQSSKLGDLPERQCVCVCMKREVAKKGCVFT